LRALEPSPSDLAAGDQTGHHRGRETGRPRHGGEAIGPASYHLRSGEPGLALAGTDHVDTQQCEVVLAGLEAHARIQERIQESLGHDRGAVDGHRRLSEEAQLTQQRDLRGVPWPANRLLRSYQEATEGGDVEEGDGEALVPGLELTDTAEGHGLHTG